MIIIDRWYAVRTRVAKECLVKESLDAKGYETLLPTYDGAYGRRWDVVRVKRPLFPGYVFCKAHSEDPPRIVTTPSVISIVSFGGKPCAVSDVEMQAIRQVTDTVVDKHPVCGLVVGCKVRIGSGPLSGIEGVLMSDAGKDWIVVGISLMQRSLAARIEPNTTLSKVMDGF